MIIVIVVVIVICMEAETAPKLKVIAVIGDPFKPAVFFNNRDPCHEVCEIISHKQCSIEITPTTIETSGIKINISKIIRLKLLHQIHGSEFSTE